jgi:excisionase family DNA binding protein
LDKMTKDENEADDPGEKPEPATGESRGDAYLTPSEAAKRLHVSPNTIARWANEGRIPCVVTLGGHRRFRPRDIDAVARQMSARGEELLE